MLRLFADLYFNVEIEIRCVVAGSPVVHWRHSIIIIIIITIISITSLTIITVNIITGVWKKTPPEKQARILVI